MPTCDVICVFGLRQRPATTRACARLSSDARKSEVFCSASVVRVSVSFGTRGISTHSEQFASVSVLRLVS